MKISTFIKKRFLNLSLRGKLAKVTQAKSQKSENKEWREKIKKTPSNRKLSKKSALIHSKTTESTIMDLDTYFSNTTSNNSPP